MTFLLWRSTSVWLCAVALFVCFDSHVDCTKPEEEADRPKTSQDSRPKKEQGQISHDEKELPQTFFDNLHLKDEEDEPDKKDHVINSINTRKPYIQISDFEEPAAETLVSEETKNGLDQNPENDNGALSTPSPSKQYSSLTEEFQDESTRRTQEEIPESVSEAVPDVAEGSHSDLVDCEMEPNPFDSDSSLPVVLENTSNAHTTGTKTQSGPPVSSPAGPSSQHLEGNVSHRLKAQEVDSSAISESDPSVGSKDPEDIPTFDEWKRKVMEVEKEKTVSTHTSTNGAPHPVKKAQKNFNNYASVECGAKILGANPEAKSTSSILKENMDLYMLNPCSNKIWFIIELCEPIQVKQLDIANFELFSSTPKEFLVSISDRYPTNKWLKLGTFHARDERTVQSFPLDEHLYAKYVKMFTKYIKVELVSHFGSEHFCPLSLIRVFGTSMVEEYEEIADPSERLEEQDDDMDYPAGHGPGDGVSKNLIGSAKDAIFNIVKDIAVVLGGSDEMAGNKTLQDNNITEPIEQNNTTALPPQSKLQPEPEVEGGSELSDFLITEHAATEEQIVTPLESDEDEPSISSIIIHLGEEEETDDYYLGPQQQQESQDRCTLFPLSPACSCAASLHEYLLRQCLLHLPKNCTLCQSADKTQNYAPNWVIYQPPSSYPQPQQPLKETLESPNKEYPDFEQKSKASVTTESQVSDKVVQPEPLPTDLSQTQDCIKTGDSPDDEEASVVEVPQLEPEVPIKSPNLDIKGDYDQGKENETNTPLEVTPTISQPLVEGLLEEKTNLEISPETKSEEAIEPPLTSHPKSPQSELDTFIFPDENVQIQTDPVLDPSTDAKIEDLAEDIVTSAAVSHPSASTLPSLSDIYADPSNGTEQNGSPVHGSSQKESVFMRLNNRIKALEMNMSLSGRYLEQLSQRYRKQMEEMQKAFNKTIIKLQNTSRVAEEQDLRQTESIQQLQGQLENVTRLVLNLSVQVIQLQSEVSDRESYLLCSLFLCLFLGLLLYVSRCRISSSCPDSEAPIPETYTYCCPERQFTRDEAALKRSASYPLIHSESFQAASTMGPEDLQHEETQSLCPANKKKRRRKVKSLDKIETLKPSFQAPELLQNKAPVLCNGVSVPAESLPLTQRLLEPPFRDSPSEGSSEASSHSDDPSFCGITAACNRICDGLPPKSRAERRALRRRRPRPSAVVDYLKAPSRHKRNSLPIYTIHDIMERREQSSYGVNVHLSGPVGL